MITNIKNNALSSLALVLGLLASPTSEAWYSGSIGFGFVGGPVYYHGDGPHRYGPGGYGYHGRGGYYYGGGPNVIINVPVERYYVPHCEDMEVCDNYTDQCWLERFCD